MARQIDLDNITQDDMAYMKQRPWLLDEIRLRGVSLPTEDEPEGEPETEDKEDEGESYSEWTNARLKAEIASRNEERDEEDQIVPNGTNKPDLVAALEADDEDDE